MALARFDLLEHPALECVGERRFFVHNNLLGGLEVVFPEPVNKVLPSSFIERVLVLRKRQHDSDVELVWVFDVDVPLGVDELGVCLVSIKFCREKEVSQGFSFRVQLEPVLFGLSDLEKVDAEPVACNHDDGSWMESVFGAIVEHRSGVCKRGHVDVDEEHLKTHHKAQKPREVVLGNDGANVQTVVVELGDAMAEFGRVMSPLGFDGAAVGAPERQTNRVAQKQLWRINKIRVWDRLWLFGVEFILQIQLSIGIVFVQVIRRHLHRDRAGAFEEDHFPRGQQSRNNNHFANYETNSCGFMARVPDSLFANDVAERRFFSCVFVARVLERLWKSESWVLNSLWIFVKSEFSCRSLSEMSNGVPLTIDWRFCWINKGSSFLLISLIAKRCGLSETPNVFKHSRMFFKGDKL
ncbi:hypothetical protein OGAPHI_003269 [Ogataea philodendri]|uniref:Uncharacterized protein n=1 Tax=Ogataea philodendri TaxID=1378263 RepID=A0A9P8P881_9ASCO|nr:uncharacterized protein OGAPHI_003269 [Ogataea philodendri]KAH3666820.1 hypothetical protein OGAPHI_003269 [Ogataea philodendri]